jgi:hypothetical protein
MRRPPVSVFLFLWFVWSFFRVGLVVSVVLTFRLEDGLVVVRAFGVPFVLLFAFCVWDTWNKPPWRIPLPERWVRHTEEE